VNAIKHLEWPCAASVFEADPTIDERRSSLLVGVSKDSPRVELWWGVDVGDYCPVFESIIHNLQ
jgi:hypothetical protein